MSIPKAECRFFQESVKFLCSHLSVTAWGIVLEPSNDPDNSMEASNSNILKLWYNSH